MCAQNTVKWTLDARSVACTYLCNAISRDAETKKRSKSMIPLTLIKTDCYIAVAFDHSRSLMGKNVRIISTKETRDEKACALHESKANKQFHSWKGICNYRLTIFFRFLLHALFHARLWTFVSLFLLSICSRRAKTRQRCEKFVIPLIYLLCVTFLSFRFTSLSSLRCVAFLGTWAQSSFQHRVLVKSTGFAKNIVFWGFEVEGE